MNVSRLLIATLISGISGLFPFAALAHPGKTNANGCHTNQATGDYHCHNPISVPSAYPYNLEVSVLSVGDGDTIRVTNGNGSLTVRLACIDAPELAQSPYGHLAALHLRELLPVGSKVTIRVQNIDLYGRSVAEIWQGDNSVNLQMVRDGQAVVYREYLNQCSTLKSALLDAEASAKAEQLGFWSQPDPVFPKDFRKQHERR